MFAVSAQVHTDSLQIPQRARCQATPLRSVREMCLLLTSPFIEPALNLRDRYSIKKTPSLVPINYKQQRIFGRGCFWLCDLIKIKSGCMNLPSIKTANKHCRPPGLAGVRHPLHRRQCYTTSIQTASEGSGVAGKKLERAPC